LAYDAWGNGYMSEAIPAVVNYCFEKLKLNRLYSYHMVRNPASGRALEKSGFTKEGLLRQRVKKLGIFEDVALWAFLQADNSSTYGKNQRGCSVFEKETNEKQ